MIDHNILLDKLKYYGVEDKHLAWFESYLSNRTQYCLWMAITPSLEKIQLEFLKDPFWVLYYFLYISMICPVSWKIVKEVYICG